MNSKEETPEIIKAVIGILIILLTVAFSIFISTYAVRRINCETYAKESNVKTTMTATTCYVKTDVGLIELDRYQLELIYRNRK